VFLSVFDMFKIGIGPSSSHTMGPMLAAGRFVDRIKADGLIASVARVAVTLHGSLAFTGKGHGTDSAIILGLLGETPEGVDPDNVPVLLKDVADTQSLNLGGVTRIGFDAARDLLFDYGPPLPGHANGMVLRAFGGDGRPLLERKYYSIGGGFVLSGEELAAAGDETPFAEVPYGFRTAAEMLEMGQASRLTVAEMKLANEISLRSETELRDGLDAIWQAMSACMARGLREEGTLPGGLGVKRRARQIFKSLEAEKASGANMRFEHTVMDWISLYALACNEENAAGGRIVTAPTNGAAGIVPAVIRYYLDFCPGAARDGIHTFLLTAAAIGGLIKHNASISGAEVGCQGEVGSASAMAAAGLAAVLGGSNAQIENAAEIALEHHLGMTCDPVGGLVQVPCIERNAMGAVKAVNAASLALRGDGTHFVPLDAAVETMRQTGLDMLSKYKETSQGGLAVNLTAC
jgi:L-serine dehydratase